MAWGPVKQYIEKRMKVSHAAEEPLYFDPYDPDALANILETQQDHKLSQEAWRQEAAPNPHHHR